MSAPADPFTSGYQAALGDIARAILDDGEPAALRWLESNLADAPTRILVSARLFRANKPDEYMGGY